MLVHGSDPEYVSQSDDNDQNSGVVCEDDHGGDNGGRWWR